MPSLALPRLFATVAIALAACSGPAQPAAPGPAPAAPAANQPAAKPTAASTHGALPFISDDYPKALAEAKQRQLPLFVDVWASWCHTCLSLQQYVLPDPQLTARAGDFVWLAIDSERASNAAFLKAFPTRNLPTLWVIDAATEKPLLKWIGAATAQELSLVLGEAAKAARGSAPEAGSAQATVAWLQGDRASAAGDTPQAVAHYREALRTAPSDWPLRARTAEALSMRFAETQAYEDAFQLAVKEGEALPPGTSRLNVVLNGVDAGQELGTKISAPDAYGKLLQLGARIARDASEPVLVDDRSTLYLSLVSALAKRDNEESQRLAHSWASLLESEASRAQLPAARRVWDPHRLEAYMALNETAKAVPMLEQSEREAPDDYNPPARLARAYLATGQPQPAAAAIDRALARCEGPRKLRLYLLKSEILVAQGERKRASDALREALRFAEAKQLAPQYDKLRQSIEQKLAELS